MICYRDMTFCEAQECLNFDSCPRALTEEVRLQAAEWWGDIACSGEAPIAIFSDPCQLDCYQVCSQSDS